MSFTDKSKNWTESEESFYSAYTEELDNAFEEHYYNLMSTSDRDGQSYYYTFQEEMYWNFVDEQHFKFEEMVQAQLARREYPDYSKFVVTL